MGYSLRIPILFSFCYCPSRFIIDNEILPLSTSTCSTQTVTTSPTDTISIGCFTNCFAILEICTSPSYQPQHLQKHQNQRHYVQSLVVPSLVLNLLASIHFALKPALASHLLGHIPVVSMQT